MIYLTEQGYEYSYLIEKGVEEGYELQPWEKILFELRKMEEETIPSLGEFIKRLITKGFSRKDIKDSILHLDHIDFIKL